MVVIRLARYGAKKNPRYRVMVADSRRWRNGKFLEQLGHYNPDANGEEKTLVLNLPKAKEWISKGAQPTDRVKTLLKLAESSAS